MSSLEFLIDDKGDKKAVVIPIEIWRKFMPENVDDFEALPDALEDFCLNRAMDEAETTPLMTKEEAIAYLEE